MQRRTEWFGKRTRRAWLGRVMVTLVALAVWQGAASRTAVAQFGTPPTQQPAQGKEAEVAPDDLEIPEVDGDDKLVPLNPNKTVLLDAKGKRVLLKTEVVLREGLLEMLCVPKQTKEHESILSVDARAYVIHTALLAIGAESGKPVQFSPEFQAPTGQKIDIFLQWTDEEGKTQRVRAQKWIRHATLRFYEAELKQLPADLEIPEDSLLRYDEKHQELSWYGQMSRQQRDELLALSDDEQYRKAIESFYRESRSREMTAEWVFAGSVLYVDQETGKKSYGAEGGDLICVANFPTAMIDVGKESAATGEENLLYEAYTERIPPLGTEVILELIPVFEDEENEKK